MHLLLYTEQISVQISHEYIYQNYIFYIKQNNFVVDTLEERRSTSNYLNI